MNLDKTIVFALSRSKEIADEVCTKLSLNLGNCEVKQFADGETLIEVNESVRGKNCYIIQSTSAPANDSVMELLIMIDALKRASARTINVIMPYYGYSRQDRKAKPRQPITSRLIADMLQTAGASRVMCFDLHASQIQGFFSIPIDDIFGLPLLASEFKNLNKSEELVVVSPDHGGTTRARKLAKMLDCPIAIIDKRRPKPNVSEVMNILGCVENKTAIMVDDMIDTAGTICAGADAIKKSGANRVLACCTHAVLSGPAIERIQNSSIETLVVTNTIYLDKEKHIDKIKVKSVAPLIAQIIFSIEIGTPVSEAVKMI